LPLVEALACGTPVVASDIPVLREVAADAAEYCGVADVAAWSRTILALIAERDGAADAWQGRKARGVARASQFSWSTYTAAVVSLYRTIAENAREVAS
jgi:glycosyltransferase involved in cell wall biosynthesis